MRKFEIIVFALVFLFVLYASCPLNFYKIILYLIAVLFLTVLAFASYFLLKTLKEVRDTKRRAQKFEKAREQLKSP